MLGTSMNVSGIAASGIIMLHSTIRIGRLWYLFDKQNQAPQCVGCRDEECEHLRCNSSRDACGNGGGGECIQKEGKENYLKLVVDEDT